MSHQVISRRDIRAQAAQPKSGRPSGTSRTGVVARFPGINAWAIGDLSLRDEKNLPLKGDEDGGSLFMAAATSLCRLKVKVPGRKLFIIVN